jgi:hypothetical protein
MTSQTKINGKTNQEIMEQVLSDPQYKGKHVIVVAGQIFTANTGDGAGKILDEVDEKYPDKTAAITYIPDADTLILWL